MGREETFLDTSVLLNFLAIGRIDLLRAHPSRRFLVTDHVRDEVTSHYGDQRDELLKALAIGVLEEVRIDSPGELEAFAKLAAIGKLGLGECAAIAGAAMRGAPLAIDDRRARNEAVRHAEELDLIGTQELVVELIVAGCLSVEQADAIKQTWEGEHRFRLKLGSFRELLD